MAETTHKSIFGIAVAIVVVVLGYFVYDRTRSPCESIFEDTATNIKADVAFIKTRGAVFIGKEKLRELDEKSNQLGLTLKACCIAAPAEFLKCKEEGSQQEARLAQIKTFVEEAQAAQTQGRTEVVQQKSAEAKRAVDEVNSKSEGFVQRVAQLQAAAPAPRDDKIRLSKGAETEPNNTTQEPSQAEMGTAIAAEVSPKDDADYFRLQYQDAKNRRDIIAVQLENLSSTLQPALILHHGDRSIARNWNSANAAGADLGFSFSADPGQQYIVGVGSGYGSTVGKYRLSVTAEKAYDVHEPNGDWPQATALKLGETIKANVMDGKDVDWYRVSGLKEKTLTVQLINQSSDLQPSIQIRNLDKSIAQNWTSANAGGADLTVSHEAELGRDYYVIVASDYESFGTYRLVVK